MYFPSADRDAVASRIAARRNGRLSTGLANSQTFYFGDPRTSGITADPAVRAKVLEGVPLQRAGEVDEVANAILFLASDEASYITGAELYVDGGYLAT